jgi:hypothetical protein
MYTACKLVKAADVAHRGRVDQGNQNQKPVRSPLPVTAEFLVTSKEISCHHYLLCVDDLKF